MLTFLAIVHVTIAILLMIFVLLQDPKDGAAGIFGGGSGSNTFFGASGASNFLSTTTKWLAVFFAASCSDFDIDHFEKIRQRSRLA